ncbi:hypothetical protein BJ944DRAFT_244724 [Cunninghamella echinulata]|nr:hypothetical protein BJ944DRAFT_244724 [Cunninghamella echinulata]
MTSIPATISTLSSHPVADDLTEELDHLLDEFCSDVQQKFCLDQHVATQQQLTRIKQTIQQARSLLHDGKWVIDEQDNNDERHSILQQVKQTILRTCLEMNDSYQAIAHQRQLRSLPEGQAQQWMHVDWQQLSQRFDTKAREQAQFTHLLSNLKQLQKTWQTTKPNHQVLKIIHSFLTTFDPPTGCHVVMVDRHNYAQLGLKRKAIGTRQLIFECQVLSRQAQMDIIATICDRFAVVFKENAHHNLLQIDTQLKRGQPNDLQQRCQLLHDCLFTSFPTAHSDNDINNNNNNNNNDNNQQDIVTLDHQSLHSNEPTSPHPFHPSSPSKLNPLQQRVDQWYATTTTTTTTTNEHSPPHPINTSPSRPTSFPLDPATIYPTPTTPTPAATTNNANTTSIPKVTTTSATNLPFRSTPIIDTSMLTIEQIPLPHFIPSPWQWPDLLKIRQPYRPWLFGLIKKRKKKGLLIRIKQFFYNQTNLNKRSSALFKQLSSQQGNGSSTSPIENNNNNNTNSLSPPPSSPPPHYMPPIFASVSVTKLSQHFIRTSQRFYQDIMLHCQLKYQQDSMILKEIGADLVTMYAALQLDISRLSMQRIITILHELNALDQSQPHQHREEEIDEQEDEEDHSITSLDHDLNDHEQYHERVLKKLENEENENRKKHLQQQQEMITTTN